MDQYRLVCKIHEIRSYIASDWPSVEERRRLYDALHRLEELLKEARFETQDYPRRDS